MYSPNKKSPTRFKSTPNKKRKYPHHTISTLKHLADRHRMDYKSKIKRNELIELLKGGGVSLREIPQNLENTIVAVGKGGAMALTKIGDYGIKGIKGTVDVGKSTATGLGLGFSDGIVKFKNRFIN